MFTTVSLFQLISMGFYEVFNSDALRNLCMDCLCLILSLDDLEVTSELQIAMSAVHWLNNQNRSIIAPQNSEFH